MSIMNPMSDSQMQRQQGGRINILLIPLIFCVLLLFGAIGFGVWAYMERQDYKDNSDQKVAEAVEAAVAQNQKEAEAQFAQDEKYPLKPYAGPSQFGSVRIEYPKTWSGYVINQLDGNSPVNWYMHPNVVPDANNQDNAFALRIEVTSESYDQSLARFDGAVRNGEATVQPYKLPKVPNVVGSRVDGKIDSRTQGRLILLPLRNMTLKIWTESEQYMSDFNDIILPRVTFSP